MRFQRRTIPAPHLDATHRMYLRDGMIPPWYRVYDNGQDITDEPVESWPLFQQEGYANGWRPIINLDGDFME